MDMRNEPRVKGWGDDDLTRYLDYCRHNQLATFVNDRPLVTDLAVIDGLFRQLLADAVDLQPFVPSYFLFRAHATYLSACGAAMAGQLYEVQVLLRACLEHAGYALYIGDDRERWNRWVNRDLGDEAKRAVRKEFTHQNVLGRIEAADADLGRTYSTLYEQTIDYGAHPNSDGMSVGGQKLPAEGGGDLLQTNYLQGDPSLREFALTCCAAVGLCALRIAGVIYPERMKTTGVADRAEVMRQRY